MKLALYHGYELSGSGSNEYTRYLARALADQGHDVVVIACEPAPEALDIVSRAYAYGTDGAATELFRRPSPTPGEVSLHQLPRTSVYPVFLTDKQRSGVVKAFPELSDEELGEYHRAMAAVLRSALEQERPTVLHANHMIYQPVICAEVCVAVAVPYYVVPHGSSIEYTVKRDPRFEALAREGLRAAAGVAWIAREVRDRVLALFPELQADLQGKGRMIGVGTDTSLFDRVAPGQRRPALDRLAAMHRPGGKTAGQRQALRDALAAASRTLRPNPSPNPNQKPSAASSSTIDPLRATQAYWDAYDHGLEDDDLPAQLARIPAEGELLFFVGAMTYGKGIQTLIAAMPGILARRPDAHLVLVGSGTYREVLEALVYALERRDTTLLDLLVARGRDLERDSTRGPLEDLAAYAATPEGHRTLLDHGPKLAGRIHFLGRLDHPRLRCIFPCARIGVFPSVIKEASPLVFAEALANGVLPTGSYHSGLRDGLDDITPHLPAPIAERMKLPAAARDRVANTVDQLSELLELLSEEDLSPQLRALAEERYDWRAVAATMADFATSIADKDPR